ncbi:uncharacterized protein PHALS_13222 [Plasmopara halstedii]|uniref:RxLR-like protein n=1 Tax=Plasmopara halstedii TaxID=4781 RepID=A0A0P1ANI9_PLAHL|nr:uncharacterized protein PHALS_13222 [Plasmopara halstedii]CEG42993.1 hypothetical protein PHALS_13222 [Plasmopara halstedii]|eukprot:XP_024579362.1 hypothetical protein PHALS_13222 [Plasmopara halstedii]
MRRRLPFLHLFSAWALSLLQATSLADPEDILVATKAAQQEAIYDSPCGITAQVSQSLPDILRPASVLGLAVVRDNDVILAIIEFKDNRCPPSAPELIGPIFEGRGTKQRLAV